MHRPRRMRTNFHLVRRGAETPQATQPALVDRWRQRIAGYQRDHGRAMAGTDLPQMQVGHPVTLRLEPVADHGFELFVDTDIEQHRSGIPNQPECPTRDDDAADDSNA